MINDLTYSIVSQYLKPKASACQVIEFQQQIFQIEHGKVINPNQLARENVQFRKISILPPQKGLEFPGGGGFCKAKKFKVMYEVYLEFLEGWVGWGGLRKYPFRGGGMDIFWNYTIQVAIYKHCRGGDLRSNQ